MKDKHNKDGTIKLPGPITSTGASAAGGKYWDKEISIPCYGMFIKLKGKDGEFSGEIHSTLKFDMHPKKKKLRAAIDAIEAMVLAHACAGIEVDTAQYVCGLETAIETIFNKFD